MYSLILHGRRRSITELQKCRNLRILVNPFQNGSAFSSSFSSAVNHRDGRKGKNFTVSYLVDSLGLATKLAESISRKVSFEDKVNPDSVLSLLRSNGFTDSQISVIITDYPRLLILDAEKSLGPKLKFLQSRGASSSELTKIVSKIPKILGKERSMSVYYDFVKEIIKADKSSKFVKLSHSLAEGSRQENKIRNVSVLRELGVPQKFLFSLLISDYGHVHGKERFEESLKKVVEMGFDPTTSKFLDALRIIQRWKKETIEEKFNVYKRLGLDVGDVWEMFKKCPSSLACSEKKIANFFETFIGLGFSRDEFTMMIMGHPQCLNLSAETVKKKTEFLVKKMNWPLKSLVPSPQVLGLSMEKRIVPRCNVINALMSKGLLGDEIPSMWSVLGCTDQMFLKKYVRKHGDDKDLVAELMAAFV